MFTLNKLVCCLLLQLPRCHRGPASQTRSTTRRTRAVHAYALSNLRTKWWPLDRTQHTKATPTPRGFSGVVCQSRNRRTTAASSESLMKPLLSTNYGEQRAMSGACIALVHRCLIDASLPSRSCKPNKINKLLIFLEDFFFP